MERLPLKEKIGYALGDTASNLTFRTVMVFLTYYYTDVYGINPATVGTIFLVTRLWDAVNDLMMGALADRTNTRWGKFRPWILWTALPFGILTSVTFMAPDLSPTGKVIYALITYNLLMMVYTASNIPYSALSGVMTGDSLERTSLSSFRFMGAFLGGLLVQGLNLPLVRYFGGGNEVKGYQYTIALFGAVATILLVVTFLTTKERVQPPPGQKTPLRKDLADLVHNRPWLITFAAGVFFVGASVLRQGVTIHYFKWYIGDRDLATFFMVLGLLAAITGAALTRYLTGLLGKKTLFLLVLFITVVASSLLYLVTPSNRILLYALNIIIEFANGPMPVLFFAMLGDSADYSEWKNGRRSTGIIFSAGTFAIKTGVMIAGTAIGWLLALFGYDAGAAAQSPESLWGIRFLLSALPASLMLVAGVAVYLYPLNERVVAEIERDLALRRAGQKELTPA